jgi:pyruvate ferredoxin oxidoreductase alpha subunit
VEIPEAHAVRAFLPPFDPETLRFRAGAPESQAVAVLGGGPYSYFRYEIHLAQERGLEAFDRVCADFAETFGRSYGPFEAYRTEDAEIVFVMMGSFATKAKAAVDALREAGTKVGLLRPRLLRPFPASALRAHLAGKKAVAVIDQNLSLGKGGILHGEIADALYGAEDAPAILLSFIGGLGGRDIAPEEFYEIAAQAADAAKSGRTPPPRLMYTAAELREMRKMQTIAEAEHHMAKQAEKE